MFSMRVSPTFICHIFGQTDEFSERFTRQKSITLKILLLLSVGFPSSGYPPGFRPCVLYEKLNTLKILRNNSDSRTADNNCSDKPSAKKTVYSNASKQFLIFVPPMVLTLHLKRFQQTLAGCR